MRMPAFASRQQLLRLQCVSSNHPYCHHSSPNAPLRDSPARLLTLHSHAARSPIGRIHPIPASSRSTPHDPAAAIPDLFDIPAADQPARTAVQRVVLSLRRGGRVVFAVCVAAVGVAALGTVGYELLFDPAHSAHAHSFQFVQHHPTAVGVLGGGRLIDMSDPMRGQLCHDTVRQVGDDQWAQCTYRVRGDAPQAGEGEVTAVVKRGKQGGWLVVYVTLDAFRPDGRRDRVVVCDYRNQVQRAQQAAAAAI